MGYEQIVNPLPSTAGTIGGIWANRISSLLSGVDVSTTDATNQPSIATPTKFLYQALRIRDSPNAKSVILQGPGGLDVDKTILIPLMPPGLNTDTLQLLNASQSPTNKIFNLASNLLTETGKALGALLKHDGVEYAGFDKGTANQVLAMNAGGTDLVWTTLSTLPLPNVVFTNAANTFTVNQTLANNISIGGMTTGAVFKNFAKVSTGNAVQLGDVASGSTNTELWSGAATAAMILSANTVTKSPDWAIVLPVVSPGSILLDNAIQLRGKIVSGSTVNIARVSITDVVQLGSFTASTVAGLALYSGNASAALNIDSGNLVTISPAWATSLVLNNNIGLSGKESGGTVRNLIIIDSSNRVGVGNSSGNITRIFSGDATPAIAFTVNNVATSTVIAQAGVAETMATWKVSDDAVSNFTLANASAVDNLFAPRFTSTVGVGLSSNSAHYWQNVINVTDDTGTVGCWSIDARRSDATDVVVRPLFVFRNRATEVFKINATGGQTCTTIATTGTAETLCTYLVTDDPGSWLDFRNSSSTDGHFTPWMRSRYAGTNAGLAAFQFSAQMLAASDTGSAPIAIFLAQTTLGANITTRPLFDFRNNATSLLQINPDGRLTVTHQDEGNIERLLDITLSDATASYFRIENNLGGVAGDFSPMLRGHRATANATYSGLYIQGSVLSATEDTGSIPVITVDSRWGTGGTLTTRPLITFRNSASNVFTINANGDTLNTIKAQAGIPETLAVWKVGDSTSLFQILNTSSVDGVFAPRIVGLNVDSADIFEFMMQPHPTFDTGTNPVFVFNARRSDNTVIQTRPLFDFRNRTLSVFKINTNGDILETIQAQAGLQELIHQWTVSDNTGSFIKILNSSAVDAQFVPRLQCLVSSAVGAANRAMYYQHYISSTMDSGSVSVCAFDARLSNDTLLTVRPLFEFYNCNTLMLQINPTNFDFKNNEIRNVVGVQTFPTQKKTGAWVPTNATMNGDGLLQNEVNVGTPAVSVGANGTLATYAVSTGAQLQGWKSPAALFRGDLGVQVTVKSSVSLTTDTRTAFGFSNQATVLNAANPLANAHIGIMIGMSDVDANLQVFFSDGVTAAKVDTGSPKSTGITHLGLRYNGTTWQYTLNASSTSVAAWIDVPGVTTSITTAMYWHCVASCVATSYSFQPRAADIRET